MDHGYIFNLLAIMKDNIEQSVLLSGSNISKYFPQSGIVINNVSFKIFKGKITGIIGPNGSGKTTLLAIITNLLKATSGEINFHKKGRTSIGAVVHSPDFLPYLTARENLKYICKLKNISDYDTEIELALKSVGLEDNEVKYGRFSYGMTQRLGIASSLIGKPELIVLDEPTNGIDPIDIEEIKQVIKNTCCPTNALLLSSHQIDEVTEICNYLLCLKNGNIIFSGEMERLKEIASDAGFNLKSYIIQLLKVGKII